MKIPHGSIVVGVDGSVPAQRALRWAASQATATRLPLLAVRATGGNEDLPDIKELDSIAAPIDVDGDPRDVLLELSRQASMIVVGTRGHGPIAGLVLGSVSSALVSHSVCPVVVVRPAPESPQGILVGADGTLASLPVIDFAFQQASLRDLPLTVTHCFSEVVTTAKAAKPLVEELRLLLAESVAGFRERYPDVLVTALAQRGLPEEVLRGDWDLVVIGRPEHGHRRGFLGRSVTIAVVEHAATSVAVVPEAKEK